MKKLYLSFISIITTLCLFAQSGTVDQTFGTDGIVLLECGTAVGMRDCEILSDNSIIAGGYCYDQGQGLTGFFLAKFDENGILDTGFGNDGTVITPIGPVNAEISAIKINNDGSIIAVGKAWIDPNINFVIARYTSTGELDQSFGNNGLVTIGIAGLDFTAQDIIIQPDNKLLVMGMAKADQLDQYGSIVRVYRFNEDGSPDTGFGSNGYWEHLNTNENIEGKAIVLQSDGKIVLALNEFQGRVAGNTPVIARIHSYGETDQVYGVVGYSYFSPNRDMYIANIDLDPDEDVIATGMSFDLDQQYRLDQWLVKLKKEDGTPDLNFGEEGMYFQNLHNKDMEPTQIVVLLEPKIITVGSLTDYDNKRGEPTSDFMILRNNPDGTLDETFGDNGATVTSISTFDFALAMAVQSDGNVIVGGTSLIDNNYQLAMVRYLNDVQTGHVKNPGEDFQLKLFPNPVNEVLQIELYNEDFIDEVIIVDIYGKTLINGEFKSAYNVSNFAPGIYALKLIAENKVLLSLKFIKN